MLRKQAHSLRRSPPSVASGSRSSTGTHRVRSCATAISSAWRAQRAVRRSIKSAPSSPTRSTSHECIVSAPYMGRSSSGTSSSFQYEQCSQAFSPPAVDDAHDPVVTKALLIEGKAHHVHVELLSDQRPVVEQLPPQLRLLLCVSVFHAPPLPRPHSASGIQRSQRHSTMSSTVVPASVEING